MSELIGFLTENCCGGNPCSPVTASAFAASCIPIKSSTKSKEKI
jgi:hypothetical protein